MLKIVEFIKNLDSEKIIQILLAVGIMLIFWVLSSTISGLIIKILSAGKKEKKEIKNNPFYFPLKTIISFVGIYIGLNILEQALQFSTEIASIITKIIKILMILLVAKAFGKGLDDKNINSIITKLKTDKNIDQGTIKFIFKVLKVAIYVIAGFMIISELGYNISGFLTSLGLGGVVLTLAAQDTAKSLIGGIAIFLDKPFKIGDYIKVGEYEGTVEDIKFRSTSIRTIENSVLHVPNSEMSVSAIINYSEIKTRRYYTKLTIQLDTNLEKINNLQKTIKNMLISNDMIKKDSIHINFQTISENGMDIIIIAYVNESDYFKYIDIKEEINYNIIDILRKENVELAYNTQIIHVKGHR